MLLKTAFEVTIQHFFPNLCCLSVNEAYAFKNPVETGKDEGELCPGVLWS